MRGGQGDRFFATVTGFEYTLYQIFNSQADLGFLAEYLYDGRESTAPNTFFQNDIFSGFRLALNDVPDTQVLGGATADFEKGEVSIVLEASRRIGDSWLIDFELRWFVEAEEGTTASAFERDGFFSVSLSRYF